MSESSANDLDVQNISALAATQTFDDRVDTDTDLTNRETLNILLRAIALIRYAPRLFTAKCLLNLSFIIPGLLLPWLVKIVTDNVLLDRPFGNTEVEFPPFMLPVVDLVSGMDALTIMMVMTSVYVVLLVVFGSRSGVANASLLQGQDAATQAENQISQGANAGGGILGFTEFLVNVRLSQRLTNVTRTRLFEKLSRLPIVVLDEQRVGDSIYRVLYDAPAAPALAVSMTLDPVFFLVSWLANMYVLQYSYGHVSPEALWVAWALFPVAFALTFPFSGALRRTNQNKRAAGAATTNTMEESFQNVAAVQSLGGSKREQAKFAARSSHAFMRERYAMAVLVLVLGLTMVAAGVALIYLTVLVTDNIIDGRMSPGDFAVLLGIYFQIGMAGMYFGAIWIKFQEFIPPMRRVFFFLDFESEGERGDGFEIGTLEQGVVFENVDYVYPNGFEALSDINLDLPVGQMIALVGPTGAGKTSLAYLLPALLLPTRGQVRFDGRDVREIDLASLRRLVTYVFQEHQFMTGTIRENLQIANPEASEQDMISALKDAGCMEFIDSLSDGIDTVLGRSGDTLSVGQQQRLSIARGLLRDSRVIILDEPTAALDPNTEARLVASLRDVSQGRLVVVIAHRLSTIRKADQIVFMEQGRVLDVGAHEDLMSREDSAYRRFVELQSG
ncbi:MAG: ABC transporter ATP-binding protein [bacterium]